MKLLMLDEAVIFGDRGHDLVVFISTAIRETFSDAVFFHTVPMVDHFILDQPSPPVIERKSK